MNKIYIVRGNTGEYSDRSEWDVKGFITKAHAEEFCSMLNGLVKANEIYRTDKDWMKEWLTYESQEIIRQKLQEYDPRAYCDYTGLEYIIDELEYV